MHIIRTLYAFTKSHKEIEKKREGETEREGKQTEGERGRAQRD